MPGVVAYIDQTLQVGQEATIYTPVPANRLLQLVKMAFRKTPTTVQIRPTGQRMDSSSYVNTIKQDVTLSGAVDYQEFCLLAEAFLGTVAPTTPVGATLTRKRVYDLPRTGAIVPKTLTAQFGDSTYANQSAGLEIVTLGATYDRMNGATLTGAGIALAQMTGGTTLTPTPTAYTKQPAKGAHLNFYLDATGAGIGATQINEEVLSASWNIQDIRKPFWAADRAQTSYKKSLSNEAAAFSVTLSLGESAAIRTIVDALEGGATYFLRIEEQGPLIETTYNFQHVVDIAIQLTDMAEYKNANTVYARDLTFTMVYDATWAHAFMFTAQNGLNVL